MSRTANETRHAPSYSPSWVDRFNQWVRRLPLRLGVFYALCALLLIAIQLIVLWVEGDLQALELLPVILFNSFFTPFLLALINLLDLRAAEALGRIRPALQVSEPDYERIDYELVHMPARPALLAGLAILIMAVLMEQLWVAPASYAGLGRLTVFTAVFQIIDKSSAFLFGVLIYHTIRQLRQVNSLQLKHLRINLFDQKPLQAFSSLTAWTAVGLVVGVYGWMLINPELQADPLILGFAGLITLLAAGVFVWPLYGVHKLMEAEKEKLLRALNQHFETAFARFDQALRADDYALIDRLNGVIASLEIQRARLAAIPTWPWDPETARFALTAIALPLLFTILQFLIVRAVE